MVSVGGPGSVEALPQPFQQACPLRGCAEQVQGMFSFVLNTYGIIMSPAIVCGKRRDNALGLHRYDPHCGKLLKERELKVSHKQLLACCVAMPRYKWQLHSSMSPVGQNHVSE